MKAWLWAGIVMCVMGFTTLGCESTDTPDDATVGDWDGDFSVEECNEVGFENCASCLEDQLWQVENANQYNEPVVCTPIVSSYFGPENYTGCGGSGEGYAAYVEGYEARGCTD